MLTLTISPAVPVSFQVCEISTIDAQPSLARSFRLVYWQVLSSSCHATSHMITSHAAITPCVILPSTARMYSRTRLCKAFVPLRSSGHGFQCTSRHGLTEVVLRERFAVVQPIGRPIRIATSRRRCFLQRIHLGAVRRPRSFHTVRSPRSFRAVSGPRSFLLLVRLLS